MLEENSPFLFLKWLLCFPFTQLSPAQVQTHLESPSWRSGQAAAIRSLACPLPGCPLQMAEAPDVVRAGWTLENLLACFC